MKPLIRFSILSAILLTCAGDGWGQATSDVGGEAVGGGVGLKVAVVAQNHVHGEFASYMDSLADLLTAELANRGFLVVNPGTALGESGEGGIGVTSSASRLAQTLGADYAILASLRSVDKTTAGIPPQQITTLKLRLTMSIATGDGFTFAAEDLVIPGPQLTPLKMASSLDGVVNEMLDRAAVECTERFAAKVGSRRAIPAAQADEVTMEITCNYPGADVMIDGVSYGTVPARIQAQRGVHDLRVSYPFCIPYEGKAMFRVEGQRFNVTLELTEEGYARWKDKLTLETIIQRIKDSGATDDYVRRVLADGNADFLKASHFRWDGAMETLTVEREGAPPIIYNPVMK